MPDVHQIDEAARQLARSSTGRHALQTLLECFDNDAIHLNPDDQPAVYILLTAACEPRSATVRNRIRDALEKSPRHFPA